MKIYADTSNINEIFDLYENNKLIRGFTTNPSLMRKAGITNYISFIKEITSKINDLPLSFEIFADESKEMEYQIQKLADYGENIFVKVPVMNTKGIPTYDIIHKMCQKGIKINITAVFTEIQMENIVKAINISVPNIISIFSGRIADTGKDPKIKINFAQSIKPQSSQILWASVREIYNIYEAEEIKCDIVTIPPDIIKKYQTLMGKDLSEFSKETVQMFHTDAQTAEYIL
jgi:transaldolase